jgi:hypothetical protein
MALQTCNHHECSEIGDLACQSCEKVYCEIHLKKSVEKFLPPYGKITMSFCNTCRLTRIVFVVIFALLVLLLLLVNYNQG